MIASVEQGERDLPENGHIPALDGLRGLAVILVMWLHMTVLAGDSPADEVLLKVSNLGWIGVDLFFVLSGFLITGVLLDSRGKEGFFVNFYARRVLRIFPLYYLILAFCFFVLPQINHPKMVNFSRIAGNEIWYWLYLSNYSIASAGQFRHAIVDISWSLAIEEQFYLFWPWVVAATSRAGLLRICLIVIGAVNILRITFTVYSINSISFYVLTPLRLDAIALGALLAIVCRERLSLKGLKRRALWVLSGSVPLVAAIWWVNGLSYYEDVTKSVGFTTVGVAASALLLLCLPGAGGEHVSAVLSNRALRFFGKYSYSLYLVHLPVRAVVRDALFRPESVPTFMGSHIPGQLLFYAVSTAGAVVVAQVSWHVVEKPCLSLKRYFVQKDQTERVAPACGA